MPEQDHVEGYLELSAKTKKYFTTAVALWDADFYVKVDDDVHVNIGNSVICFICYPFWEVDVILMRKIAVQTLNNLVAESYFCFISSTATLGGTLARLRKKPRVYIGCMKSGHVLNQK